MGARQHQLSAATRRVKYMRTMYTKVGARCTTRATRSQRSALAWLLGCLRIDRPHTRRPQCAQSLRHFLQPARSACMRDDPHVPHRLPAAPPGPCGPRIWVIALSAAHSARGAGRALFVDLLHPSGSLLLVRWAAPLPRGARSPRARRLPCRHSRRAAAPRRGEAHRRRTHGASHGANCGEWRALGRSAGRARSAGGMVRTRGR